jgi:hypothetical protein
MKPPYFVNLQNIYSEVYINDYNLSGFEISDTKISVNKQIHKGGSFGITIDDKLPLRY